MRAATYAFAFTKKGVELPGQTAGVLHQLYQLQRGVTVTSGPVKLCSFRPEKIFAHLNSSRNETEPVVQEPGGVSHRFEVEFADTGSVLIGDFLFHSDGWVVIEPYRIPFNYNSSNQDIYAGFPVYEPNSWTDQASDWEYLDNRVAFTATSPFTVEHRSFRSQGLGANSLTSWQDLSHEQLFINGDLVARWIRGWRNSGNQVEETYPKEYGIFNVIANPLIHSSISDTTDDYGSPQTSGLVLVRNVSQWLLNYRVNGYGNSEVVTDDFDPVPGWPGLDNTLSISGFVESGFDGSVSDDFVTAQFQGLAGIIDENSDDTQMGSNVDLGGFPNWRLKLLEPGFGIRPAFASTWPHPTHPCIASVWIQVRAENLSLPPTAQQFNLNYVGFDPLPDYSTGISFEHTRYRPASNYLLTTQQETWRDDEISPTGNALTVTIT